MLIDLIKNAGVVGAGGAGFPTHIKLNAKAEYFIVNAAECEPLIETDKYICRNHADELIEAIELIGNHLDSKHLVIVIKEKYKDEIEALNNAIKKSNAKIELFYMDSFYPAGDEQVIVQLVTGKSVPERGIPLDVGAVVDNVGTVLWINNAFHQTPVTEKYLSVTGLVENPIMIKVPLGTSITDCVNMAKPQADEYDILLGGPMMGKIFSEKSDIASKSVVKTTGNIMILPKEHYLTNRFQMPLRKILKQAQSVCLQCRFCTDQCPRYRIGHNIRPHTIMRRIFMESSVIDNNEYERFYGEAANCSECGVCEMYSCPMGLSPRKVNVFIKGQLREKNIDVHKNMPPIFRESVFSGWPSTSRLIARLGLSRYAAKHAANECIEMFPDKVNIPFSQHIGAPAVPIVKTGDTVKKGDMIAEAKENALSSNIHCGIDGRVESVNDQCAVISRKG